MKEEKAVSPAVQERIDSYQALCKDLENEGYHRTDCTISVLKANIFAFLTAGPVAALGLILYLFKWNAVFTFSGADFLILFLLLVAMIPIHELIHGIAWGLFCRNGWRSIRFGMMWKSLTPYCHCKEPLPVVPYLIGSLAPFFVLGVVPCLIACATANPYLLWLSVFNLLSAGGDTTIALMLIGRRQSVILDHPTKCGFTALKKQQ